MYRIKAQKNDERITTADVFPPDFEYEYGTEFEAAEQTQMVADDYASLWCADVYHAEGMSTVYFDDGQYTVFWFTDIGI